MEDAEFYDDLWDILAGELKEQKLLPGEMTAAMFGEKMGLGLDRAREILNKWALQGKVTKRKLKNGVGGKIAYMPVEKLSNQ